MASFFIILFLTDAKYQLIPNKIVIPAIVFTFLFNLFQVIYTLLNYYKMVSEDEFGKYDIEILKKISVARCAHISYKLNGGTQSSAEKNVTLCNRLINDGHWSPFEHVAIVLSTTERCGNFLGFKQYRKFFESENGGDYEKR